MARYAKWYIGPTTGGSSRGVEVRSVETCAGKIADTDWFEYDGSQMAEAETVEITCSLQEDNAGSNGQQMKQISVQAEKVFDNFLSHNFNVEDFTDDVLHTNDVFPVLSYFDENETNDTNKDKNIADHFSPDYSITVDLTDDSSPITDIVPAEAYSKEDLKNTIIDDSLDIYFVLRNWTHLWNTHTTGSALYSSNYPGGIFRTIEGYEFELAIYPQECRRKIECLPVSS